MGLFRLIGGWLGGVLPFTVAPPTTTVPSAARTFVLAEDDRTFTKPAQDRIFYVDAAQ